MEITDNEYYNTIKATFRKHPDSEYLFTNFRQDVFPDLKLLEEALELLHKEGYIIKCHIKQSRLSDEGAYIKYNITYDLS